jgi:protein-tyrosine phosphatase
MNNKQQNCVICGYSDIDNIIYNEHSYCKSCYKSQIEQLLEYHKERENLSSEIVQITEKIYLGNQDASQDCELLKSLNISNILVCGNYLDQHHPNEFKYLQFFINDAVEQNISDYFQSSIEFIESSEKNVFIHCAAGISRSASFVISYLMWKNKLRYEQALDFVRTKRHIYPNSGFVRQLKIFEKLIFK